jgi:hypothetical protein
MHDPVPPEITRRAVELLHRLVLGQTSVETIACSLGAAGEAAYTFCFVCEPHSNAPKGITVYQLVA